MVTAHASLRGSWSREHWPPEEDKQQRRSDGDGAVREGGPRVAVKADHDKVRWASCPVADGLDSSHCSIHEADVNPEVAGEHHTG